MQPLELVVVWSEAAVIQRDGLHAVFRHVFLCQHLGYLASPVVAEVEEYNRIAFIDGAFRLSVLVHYHDRLYELIGHVVVVRCLYAFGSRAECLSLAGCQQVVGEFYAVPSLVPVHGIITSAYRSDFPGRPAHLVFKVFYEPFSAFRVAVAPVHEAVYIYVFQPV